MRIVLGMLILLHGLIHLLGFVKAFDIAEVSQLSLPITKPLGLFWLIAALLFLISGALFFYKQTWWWMAILPAIIISQVLIIIYWQDAKAGTVLNIILLAGCLLGYGNWDFQSMVEREKESFFASVTSVKENVTIEEAAGIPAIVSLWMKNSGMADHERINSIYFRQKGTMKTSPQGRWMPVEAEQFVKITNPGYLWIANVEAAPYVYLAGRDKYIDGKGHMLIKLLSLIPVADSQGEEIDQGSLLRYLAEMVWYPGAALEPYISWEAVDDTKAKATMSFGKITASGLFEFNKMGDPLRFEAERYYDRKEGATLETWVVDIESGSFRTYEGLRVPTRANITWKLAEGDFTWYKLQISELTYNRFVNSPKGDMVIEQEE